MQRASANARLHAVSKQAKGPAFGPYHVRKILFITGMRRRAAGKGIVVPELSRFYGIIVTMYVEVGSPHSLPHIHAKYADKKAVYSLEGQVLRGRLPIKQHKLRQAWIALHEQEGVAVCSREWDIGLDVVAVKADAGHTVVVTWTDGFVGRFDVASYLKHCPASWQHVLDDGYFGQVRIAETGDTIEWPDGQDVAPETLYEQAIAIDAAR